MLTIFQELNSLQVHKNKKKIVDCKSVRIFAYSSRLKTESETGERLRVRLAWFARVRFLRPALPISLLILRKKPTVLQSKKIVFLCSRTSSMNLERFTSKSCTKKRDARAKLLPCQSKPIAFLPFPWTSMSDDLQQRRQHSVATLQQCCNHSKQCRNNVATL